MGKGGWDKMLSPVSILSPGGWSLLATFPVVLCGSMLFIFNFFWSFGFLHYIILDAADCTSKFRFIRTIITGDSDHNGHIHVLLLFNTSLK